MKKDKKDTSYIGFVIICIILGSILISVGHFIKHDLKKVDTNLIDLKAVVSHYEKADGDKVNVICKYGYEGNEYNYVCQTVTKEEANEKYKIGSERIIKVNAENPGRITILDLNYVIIAVYSIGLIFLILAILYMISEVIRLAKRNKVFNDQLEESNE